MRLVRQRGRIQRDFGGQVEPPFAVFSTLLRAQFVQANVRVGKEVPLTEDQRCRVQGVPLEEGRLSVGKLETEETRALVKPPLRSARRYLRAQG